MHRREIFLLILWFTTISTYISAQAPDGFVVNTRHLSADDGLVNDAVLCGLQDSQGFIWLGTPDGLQRYDGVQFKLYSREKNGLQANNVCHLALGSPGLLWITYASAVNLPGRVIDILDTKTGTIKSFTQTFGSSAPVAEKDIFLAIANEVGDVFLVTIKNEVWMYRNKVFKKIYNHPKRLLYTRRTWQHRAKGAHLWLTLNSGDNIKVDTSGVWHDVLVPGYTYVHPRTLYPNGSALLCANEEDASRQPLSSHFFLADAVGKVSPVSNLAPDLTKDGFQDLYQFGKWDLHTGTIGLQNEKGISLVTPDGKSIITVVDSVTLSTRHNAILKGVFSDASGKFWLCTSYGIWIADVRPRRFRNFLDRSRLTIPLTNGNQARGIIRTDHGTTLAALWDGVYEFSETSGEVLRRVPCHIPTVLFRDNGHIRAVTRDSILDLQAGKGIAIAGIGSGHGNEIWAIFRDGKRLLAGTIHGIWDIGGPYSDWKLIPGQQKDKTGWCYHFCRDHNGVIWASTSKGLLKIVNGRITESYLGEKGTLPATDILQVSEDRNGDLWLCTNGSGLIYWNRKSNRFKKYTVADGLSSNVLYGLLTDEEGLFWISSNRGLIHFDPKGGTIKVYTTKDGLIDNEFNRLSYYKADDGQLYFGGVNGLVTFHPKDLNRARANSYQAPLRIRSFYRYNAGQDRLEDQTEELLQSKTIEIRPEDRFYTLNFRLLDFEPQQHTYAYRIEGLENQWSYLTESSLRLGNLPYGDYVLRIKGRNNGGTWSTSQLVLRLKVLRPFYRETWFIILGSLAVAALVWLAVRWRERRLRAANDRLEQVISQRTGQLAQMLHEKDLLMKEIHHRVKNNLQVISSLQQMQASRSLEPAVRAALTDSQNRVLSIAFIHENLYRHDDLKGVEMKSFVHELGVHVLEVFTDKGQEISVEQHVEQVTLDIDTAVPIGLILNELLTNSCKHAFRGRSEGKITIVLKQESSGHFKLEYSDDGPGLDAATDLLSAGTLGLKLVTRLAEQLDGKLEYHNSPQATFVITFKDFETRNTDQ
ncbi:MAG: histidine kinase dimerization/phosphoacceptor domain -containing protein [Bacteroidota bacterium]